MRYYPVGLNEKGGRCSILWQSCHNYGKSNMCLMQTKNLFEPPYEIDDSEILVLKTFTEAKHSDTKQMIVDATQIKSKNVKIKKSKNV